MSLPPQINLQLQKIAKPKMRVAIIGFGKFGREIHHALKQLDCSCQICDPPLAASEADEVRNGIFELWGNGMGGSYLDARDNEAVTFLPLSMALRNAKLVCIQIPLDGNSGLIEEKHVRLLDQNAIVLNFSSPEIISPNATKLLKNIINCQ